MNQQLTDFFARTFEQPAARQWQERTRFLEQAQPINGGITFPETLSWTEGVKVIQIDSPTHQSTLVDLFRRKTLMVEARVDGQQAQEQARLETVAQQGFPAAPPTQRTPILQPNTPHFDNTVSFLVDLSKLAELRQQADDSAEIDAQIAAL